MNTHIITLTTLGIATSMLLVGCGPKEQQDSAIAPTQDEQENPSIQTGSIDMPPVDEADVVDFNTLIGGKRVAGDSDKESIFRFYEDNTFEVVTPASSSRGATGPWIVSEGNILLGESELPLEIIDQDTITIQGVEYKRFEDTV